MLKLDTLKIWAKIQTHSILVSKDWKNKNNTLRDISFHRVVCTTRVSYDNSTVSVPNTIQYNMYALTKTIMGITLSNSDKFKQIMTNFQ